MSPNAQRIAIADAIYGDNYSVKLVGNPQPEHYRWGDKLIPTPDYVNDLNAMHEAEKVLPADKSEEGCWGYIGHLIEIVQAEGMDLHREVFVVAHATAAQRAEAFLRTIGKWEATP